MASMRILETHSDASWEAVRQQRRTAGGETFFFRHRSFAVSWSYFTDRNMVEIIRIAAIKLNSHFTFEHRRIQFNFEMSLTLWSKQLVLSCPTRGQHWFTKVLSGKPAGSLTKTEQASYKSTPIVDLKKKILFIIICRLVKIMGFLRHPDRGISWSDGWSTALLLLHDFVKVADFFEWQLLIWGSCVIMWAGSNVLETRVSINGSVSWWATLEVYTVTPAVPVQFLAPLKHRRKEVRCDYKHSNAFTSYFGCFTLHLIISTIQHVSVGFAALFESLF